MDQYNVWIDKKVAELKRTTGLGVYGKCTAVTIEMLKDFPELKRVRGHYMCLAWGKREHWWLVDTEGNIIDPTLSQFPTKTGEYVPWVEGSPEPTGKCPNCGDYCFNGAFLCSETCFTEYGDYP